MIEWRSFPNYAFYADDRHTKVGYFYVDKTKTKPYRWRLRLWLESSADCSIIKIAAPEDTRYPLAFAANTYQYSQVRTFMGDLKVAAAKFMLKPIGQQKTVPNTKCMHTDLLGMPHDRVETS